MIRRIALMILFAGLGGQAVWAQSSCERLGTVFERVQGKRSDAGVPLALPGLARCVDTLNENGVRMTHCYWSFDYRDPAATARFDSIVHDLQLCAAQSSTGDQLVNHPDSYDRFATMWQGRAVSVSLKDKGALQQTLVFLAIDA